MSKYVFKQHRHNCRFFSIDVLFPNGTVPEEVKQVQTERGWDAMVREAFVFLHKVRDKYRARNKGMQILLSNS